ncbi:GNAT family N-acetyltransferase [Streptomyces apocyni]|uniref:GNAT family N-acetyltransferase n=1 Tax=Streptomyces apocyni TaxID=2654677 RepID=UPI0018D0B634|nr:GNAT family N-acetyltransferase [Streptomyces apocyni]
MVRGRRDGDLEDCVRALAEVHRRDGYPVNWPAEPAAWLSPPSLLAAWVAELDGRVVGHIGLCGSGPGDAAPALWGSRQGGEGGATAVVSRLFVAPVARGQGIGALLVRGAVQDARGRALQPVLDVVASDAAALALYERLGWEALGTVEQRWGPGQTVAVRCFAAPPSASLD